MEFTNANIKFFSKAGFYSVPNQNEKHVKVLPYLSIVQSVEGSYDIGLGDSDLEQTGDGGFFIAPAGVQQSIIHNVNKQTGKMTARWVFIDLEINNAYSIDNLYKFPMVIKDDRKDILNAFFDRIFSTDNLLENYSECYKMIAFLIETAMPIKNLYPQGIRLATAYMMQNYDKKVTISTLADIANTSEPNFYALFKKHLGESPIAYLNHHRLSIATNMLMQSNHTISEIADMVGINDSLYFSKLFKKNYGMTPTEYRTVYKSNTTKKIND